MTFAAFHFLRPEWLLALFPAALMIYVVARGMAQGAGTEWAGLVDTHLLRHLTVNGAQVGRSRWWVGAFAAGLLAAVLAMAGPTWEKQLTPAFKSDAATVVVLSLAQSMNGDDIVPSRLTRATHKLRDILDRAKGGDVGLVIYADKAFVAAPLTDDGAVIRQMLPELSTNLMPVLGNSLDLAITDAQGLLDRAGAGSGRIVVLADDVGLDGDASNAAATAARNAGYSVSVLGVGTPEGSTLQTAGGQAIQTRDGQDVTVSLNTDALTKLAQVGGGQFAVITANDADLDAVLPDQNAGLQGIGGASDQNSDTWLDFGYYLLLIPVLLAPLAFRRGLLMMLALGVFSLNMLPGGAQAGSWDDLWRTSDQQAQRAYDAGDFADAAALYSAPDAKGTALYREGKFTDAAQQFGGQDFNRGNALAKSGAFEQALAAYDARLANDPEDADAQFNRNIVAKLLEDQKQEQQKQDQDQQKDQSDKGQSGQDQQDQKADNKPSDQSGDQQDQSAHDQSDMGQSGQDQSDQAKSDQGQGDQKDQQAQGGAQDTKPADQGGQDQASADGSEQEQEAPAQGDDKGQPQQNADAQQQADTPKQGNDQPGDLPAEDTAQANQAAAAQAQPDAQDKSDFSDQMDQVLGNAEPSQEPQEGQATARGAPVLNQAAEQQLRKVPDDPSGLLRARIRQHYDRLRAGDQRG